MTSTDAVSAPKLSFYRPELDGLRSVAFLGVFITHALPNQVDFWVGKLGPRLGPWARAGIEGGRFGVDLFFVLSAYLITEVLLREKRARGTISIPSFYARRALRIWPLYFAFVALVLVLGATTERFAESLTTGYKIGLLTFTSNWVIAITGFQISSMNVLWSVGIEEQFYLTWPFLVRSLSLKGLRVVALCLIPVAVVTRVLLMPASVWEFDANVWCNLFARVDTIALGVLAAVVLDGRIPRLRAALARVALLATPAIIVALVRFGCFFGNPVVATASYLVAALGCLSCVLSTLSLGARSLLATRIPIAVGRVSYGAYVLHFFVLRALPPAAWKAPLALLLTLACAAASFRWLERPFLKLKERVSAVTKSSGEPAAESKAA